MSSKDEAMKEGKAFNNSFCIEANRIDETHIDKCKNQCANCSKIERLNREANEQTKELLSADEEFISEVTNYLGGDAIAHAYATDILEKAKAYRQSKLNEVTDEVITKCAKGQQSGLNVYLDPYTAINNLLEHLKKN